MKKLMMFLVVIIIQNIFAQGVTPKEWGMKAFQIQSDKFGDIEYYVTEKGIEQVKPLLFLVSGCRGLPIMLVVDDGQKSIQLGTIPPDQIHAFAEHYHVVMISKAGTSFCDTMQVEAINPMQNLEDYQPSDEYIQKCGMEWEIQASSKVIDRVCQSLPVNTIVVVMGFSEGGVLVPRLAASNSNVTHMVSVVSTGLNQFYSSIINRRMDAAMGHLTQQEAQSEIDSLFAVYKKIYSDPQATEKWYYGHPYKRWGSFCNYIPIQDLVQLDIPLLYVNGTTDRNSPILQADYIQLEFIRLGKDNLTYYTLPDVGHWLYEEVEKEGEKTHVNRRNDVFEYIANWIDKSSESPFL